MGKSANSNQILYHVAVSDEYIKEKAVEILAQHIKIFKHALPLCKHTKRKNKLLRKLKDFEEVRKKYTKS